MVITGDATQVDLPGGTASGLRVIEDVLTGVDDVEFCRLTSSDVVRHRLVSDIIDAYARWDVATAPARDREAPRGGRRADHQRNDGRAGGR
jgi:phosphate starvation-inducible PhoH-like protein